MGILRGLFPLLTKILDANRDLSVQVHPNDEYARINENGELGKLNAGMSLIVKKVLKLFMGIMQKTKDKLVEMVEQEEWDKLLQRVKVKPGDFFFVPSGTVHAIGEGILILETQQNSDTTYRLYDYNRRDSEGNCVNSTLRKVWK